MLNVNVVALNLCTQLAFKSMIEVGSSRLWVPGARKIHRISPSLASRRRRTRDLHQQSVGPPRARQFSRDEVLLRHEVCRHRSFRRMAAGGTPDNNGREVGLVRTEFPTFFLFYILDSIPRQQLDEGVSN